VSSVTVAASAEADNGAITENKRAIVEKHKVAFLPNFILIFLSSPSFNTH
jgi:hypothetical protein